MSSELPPVFAIAGDPGGARALLPVLKRLRMDGRVRLEIHAYRQASAIFEAAGLPAATLAETANQTLAAERRLAEIRPVLLLGATSVNGVDWEKHFFGAARRAAVPSLAVLDFWSNYVRRFSSEQGHLDLLPDRIAVMDQRAAAELGALDVPRERIAITGQPAFDELAAQRDAFSGPDRLRVRNHLGVGEKEPLVVFVSQPLRKFAEEGLAAPDFDERSVLALVQSTLARDSVRGTLVVRPHPRESFDWFRPTPSTPWRTVIDRESDSHEIALAADLVVGMNSVMLLEACYLGCLVLSLQPGRRGPDLLPSNASGASVLVDDAAHLPAALLRLLHDADARETQRGKLKNFVCPANATRQVVTAAYAMLASSFPTLPAS